MLLFGPAQVCAGNKLLIAEQERVAGIGIAQIQRTRASDAGQRGRVAAGNAQRKSGQAIVKRGVAQDAGAMGSWNVQVVKPFRRAQIERRPQPLASEAKIPVEQHGGRESMCRAQTDALNQARRGAELTAVGRIPACVTKERWIEYQRAGEAVTPKNRALRGGNVVDFEVGVVAVEQRRPTPHEVVQAVTAGKNLLQFRLQQ